MAESQLHDIVRVVLRAKRFIPVALVAALTIAIATYVYLRMTYSPRYTSEAVALVLAAGSDVIGIGTSGERESGDRGDDHRRETADE